MTHDMRDNKFGLPPGNWRFDPATRVQVWVPDDPLQALDRELDEPEPVFAPTGKHGTEHGYNLHRRSGIATCEPCRRAMNEASRRRRANRRLNNEKDAA